MSKIVLLGITLIVLLATIFLISLGTTGDSPTLWWIGLILIGVGGIIPPITRFTYEDEE